MVELVEELEKLPKSKYIDFMIQEAKQGEYHDYKNRKYICGKMESSCRLRELGFVDLAKRIESGEFDEEADEIDKQKMRNELGDSEIAKLFGL
jgi:hypothetical protein